MLALPQSFLHRACLAAGLGLTGLSFVAGVVQWGVLLRGAQSMVRWRSVASWQAQSVFAGHVLPTAAAGDAVRAVNACRAAGNGTAIGSILGSRLAGSPAMERCSDAIRSSWNCR